MYCTKYLTDNPDKPSSWAVPRPEHRSTHDLWRQLAAIEMTLAPWDVFQAKHDGGNGSRVAIFASLRRPLRGLGEYFCLASLV